MSKPTIPTHIKNLIQELTPYVAPGAKDMDVIFAGLLSLKDKYILSSTKVGIDDPRHSFYFRATPEEEKGLEKSFKELQTGQFIEIAPEDDILKSLDSADL